MHEKDTEELFSELKEDKDIRQFLSKNRKELLLPLHEYLGQLLEEKGLRKMEVVQASLLERTYAYHIFSGLKPNPSRVKLLALALAMHLDLDETQHLLRYARQSMLYPRDPWDSVIISAIQKGLPVKEANILLEQMGETQMLG